MHAEAWMKLPIRGFHSFARWHIVNSRTDDNRVAAALFQAGDNHLETSSMSTETTRR